MKITSESLKCKAKKWWNDKTSLGWSVASSYPAIAQISYSCDAVFLLGHISVRLSSYGVVFHSRGGECKLINVKLDLFQIILELTGNRWRLLQITLILLYLFSDIPLLGAKCQEMSRGFPQNEIYIPPWSSILILILYFKIGNDSFPISYI